MSVPPSSGIDAPARAANDYPDPVRRLLTVGASAVDEKAWPDYVALFGFAPEHVADLLRMACDEDLHGEGPDSSSAWAPVHAWRSLGQLRAPQAVLPLLTLLRGHDDDDGVLEELPAVLAMIGPEAVPELAAALRGPSQSSWVSVAIISAFQRLGLQAECRDECVGALARFLRRKLGVNQSANGFAVSALIRLAAVEAIEPIRDAFRRKVVDMSIAGDLEDVEIGLKLRTGRSTPPRRYAIAPRVSPAPPAKVGRNDPCPCGSGAKYKKCCMARDAETRP